MKIQQWIKLSKEDYEKLSAYVGKLDMALLDPPYEIRESDTGALWWKRKHQYKHGLDLPWGLQWGFMIREAGMSQDMKELVEITKEGSGLFHASSMLKDGKSALVDGEMHFAIQMVISGEVS